MQWHQARLPTKVELQHGFPPKVPCAAQEGPATPTHAWIQPSSKQGGQPLLSQVGASSRVQSWDAAPSGCPSPRWAPQGKERQHPCCVLQLERLPDCSGEIISFSPTLFFFLS